MSKHMFESLESRRLLSAAFVTRAGVLEVLPDAFAKNTITVETGTNGIDVTVNSVRGNGVTRTFSKTIPTSGTGVVAPTSVLVFGTVRADNISVGDTGNFTLATRIDDRGGADVVKVGDQNAVINSGFGNSTITAGNGNDIVRGLAGTKSITVGNGNDKIRTFRGKDTIVAGDGNDTVIGGAGADTITVGNGADLIFGGPGPDHITAGNGNDTVWGGAGADVIIVGTGTDKLGAVLGNNNITAGHPDTYVVKSLASLQSQTTTYDPTKGDTFVLGKKQDPTPVV